MSGGGRIELRAFHVTSDCLSLDHMGRTDRTSFRHGSLYNETGVACQACYGSLRSILHIRIDRHRKCDKTYAKSMTYSRANETNVMARIFGPHDCSKACQNALERNRRFYTSMSDVGTTRLSTSRRHQSKPAE